MNITYIHYGHDYFEPNQFRPVMNVPYIPKPKYGFWASKTDAEFGWKEWCEQEDFNTHKLKSSFTFNLQENAKIIVIKDLNDITNLPKQNIDNAIPLMSNEYLINFQELSFKYDAIEVLAGSNYDLYWNLYTWDCDSICIMNPEIIRGV